MATHSSILAQRSPWTEKCGRLGLQLKESDKTGPLALSLLTFIGCHTSRFSAIYHNVQFNVG